MEKSVRIIVCAFDMERELPRTIRTLSASAQGLATSRNYEIIVLDNGSAIPVAEDKLQALYGNLRVIRASNFNQSPVEAINRVMSQTDADLIGLWIDGARMATPGIVQRALDAHSRDPNSIIATLAFHLGAEVQMESMMKGYNQKTEDALLATVDWQSDAYALFEVSALAGSSCEGWFGNLAETNGMFFSPEFLKKMGPFDERFKSPGGGLANLELWQRAVICSHRRPWMLLGEGTFHQFHGGAATNAASSARMQMMQEYIDLFGKPFVKERYSAQYVGSLDIRAFSAGLGTSRSD